MGGGRGERRPCACGWSAQHPAVENWRGGRGRAGAGARPDRGRNAPVLRRAVGLAVGCGVRPLPRPVRGSRLRRGGGDGGRKRGWRRGACWIEARAGGGGGRGEG